MAESSTPETLPARPVTPHGIIAAHLDELRDRARALAYDDPAFAALLDATANLAIGLDPYLDAMATPASETLERLAADTAHRDWTRLYASGETALPLEQEMVSGHVEGRFLNMLVRTAKPRRILEVGLFTGYSALAMAEALPADGVLIACEIDAYAASVARAWFDRSPHGAKIRIEIGPARDTLLRLRDAGEAFDFVFIDADKGNYTTYLDLIVGSTLLAADGLVCVDNTLLQGEPYLAKTRTTNGEAIAAFNRHVAEDPRLENVLVPIRDGLTMIRRAARP